MTVSKLRKITGVTYNNSTEEERIENLKRMDNEIYDYGDEELIWPWIINAVPDCPTEDDFEFIANDEEMYNDTLELFEMLCKEME